jgi:hypothetical protein
MQAVSFVSNNSSESGETSGLTSLVKKLLVAWGCGLLFGSGIFLMIYFIAGFAGAAAGSFGSFNAGPWITLICILSLGIIMIGPILMETYLGHSWRKGFIQGALATLIAGIVGVIMYYVGGTFILALTNNNISNQGSNIFLSMLVGVSAGAAVTTIICNRSHSSFEERQNRLTHQGH